MKYDEKADLTITIEKLQEKKVQKKPSVYENHVKKRKPRK